VFIDEQKEGKMSSVCLSMIVKDEARVIERCLRSVRDFVDYWVICDTGSTDETVQVIRSVLAKIPGYVHHSQWVDFGHNRSEALALARPHADYSLMLDADEILVCSDVNWKDSLSLDGYHINVQLGTTKFSRLLVFNNLLPWRFDGVVHEHPECVQTGIGPAKIGHLLALKIESYGDGARHADGPTSCYVRDCELLEKAVGNDPEDSRSCYYYAQTLMNCGRQVEAYHEFMRRLTLTGWEQERYCAAMYAASLAALNMDALGLKGEDVLHLMFSAFLIDPCRSEAPYRMAELMRLADMNAAAYRMSYAAMCLPSPDDSLFKDTSVDAWAAAMTNSIVSYWVGKNPRFADIARKFFAQCEFMSEELCKVAPEHTHDQLRRNADFARAEMEDDPWAK
jgi:hypothetical protein